jgi:glycosyltransferase involved in cell wall biosynthesis
MNGFANEVTIVGHPYATVGMGEQMRSHMAALHEVHLKFKTVDIFRFAPRTDPDYRRLVGDTEAQIPGAGIRLFHVNADEVDRVKDAFEQRGGDFQGGYNIVVPAWELPKYPDVWAEKLREFHEVWALSDFIARSLAAADVPSHYIGQSVQLPTGYFFPRRYFGIRESAFVILHFFDLSSFATRKNPQAVIAMLKILQQRKRFADVQLVLKVKKGDEDGEEWLEAVREQVPGAVCISKPLNALETRSLLNAADCFASLHRSEGFGRGLGEAMFLGRLALGTGYSGNVDFMRRENSLLVDYQLIAVQADQYPHAEGQVWAEPDIDQAANLLESAINDPKHCREVAMRGRADVTAGFSNRAVGLRILSRLSSIGASAVGRESSA